MNNEINHIVSELNQEYKQHYQLLQIKCQKLNTDNQLIKKENEALKKLNVLLENNNSCHHNQTFANSLKLIREKLNRQCQANCQKRRCKYNVKILF